MFRPLIATTFAYKQWESTQLSACCPNKAGRGEHAEMMHICRQTRSRWLARGASGRIKESTRTRKYPPRETKSLAWKAEVHEEIDKIAQQNEWWVMTQQ